MLARGTQLPTFPWVPGDTSFPLDLPIEPRRLGAPSPARCLTAYVLLSWIAPYGQLPLASSHDFDPLAPEYSLYPP